MRLDGLALWLGGVRIIAIADDERELIDDGSSLRRHHHRCGFRGVQIQRCNAPIASNVTPIRYR